MMKYEYESWQREVTVLMATEASEKDHLNSQKWW